jgi:hypothetical protein
VAVAAHLVVMARAEEQAEIARADADEPGVQALREEVLTLRSMLDSPRARHHWIAEGLHAVGDAAKAAV